MDIYIRGNLGGMALNHLVEQKIQQIKQDIEAIKNGEMLAIHNESSDKKRDEEEAIELQKWRIRHLENIRDMPIPVLERNLALLQKEKQTFETSVMIDLYRIALGVL